MIRGVGCDLVDVSRVEPLLERPRFWEKVFTPGERAALKGKGASSAAGLWAAKEAVAKALGTGFQGFGPREIEIGWTTMGQPAATLHGGAKLRLEALGASAIHLSISHEVGQAMAFAVVE